MKTIQVGNIDTAGARFNGTELHQQLLNRGIKSQLCVWVKKTNDKNTWRLGSFVGSRALIFAIKQIEKILSIQSVLYPLSLQFFFDRRFHSANLVHYHLIHAGFFSIITLPKLSKMKPTIWTLHDPWAMTGHCIYPLDCVRWKTGCGNCPNLNTHIPMFIDNTRFMWKIKKWVFHNSDIDIVVASKWMLNMAKQSPLLSKTRVHYIPFGIDLDVFNPSDVKKTKLFLGINPDCVVLAFRATTSEFKGLSYIRECIKKLNCDKQICLLTIGEKNLFDDFREEYHILDLGWISENELPVFYNACDIFLMPSTAEAFGVMAIEAMACEKTVVVFEGTSLPEVIFAPNGGIAVPQGDVDALRRTVESLINNPEIRQKIGKSALDLVKKNYDADDFMDKMIELYGEVIKQRREKTN
ncbi:glycosyltransferase [Methanolobus sp. WCC5]|uniref:glycosyltransferase n=1 Tax=Methanolobus sp. WCC5 TaxID=3125785 RepID=UPI0032460833